MDVIARYLVFVAVACLLNAVLFAATDEKVQADEGIAGDQSEEKMLLRLSTLEQSFKRASTRRKLLALKSGQLQQQLRQEEGEKRKQKLLEQLKETQKDLRILNIAFDILFSPGRPYELEYNPVKATVYAKVGNLEGIFFRAVKTQESLQQQIDKQEEKAADKDDGAESNTGQKREALKRQHETITAALQLIFGISPQRNYKYDAKHSMLYLKVTEEEAEQLRAKARELREKQSKNNED
ncbi:MAG: hypothetical protein K9N51_03140 [Candidatus Pacebacteria bacterium]|nr:hypothetical protein [Candidatus Paceibacterota bacterium]